jgi:hypothetical protein
VQGIQPGDLTIAMKVQCKGCDEHVHPEGVKDTDWVTVAEDWNQEQLYARAGLTAAVNRPDAKQADGSPVQWRVLVSPQAGAVQARLNFSSDPATSDGGYAAGRGGDPPPKLHAYDVANTDVFADLNPFFADAADRFSTVDPRQVIAGTRSLAGIRTLVLADGLLPGYTGLYAGEPAIPGGAPTPGFEFASSGPTAPGQGASSCSRTAANVQHSKEFTINPGDGNAAMSAVLAWETPGDYDIYAQRREGADWKDVKAGTSGDLAGEQVEVPFPQAGLWRFEVVNCIGTDPGWTGKVTFTAQPAPSDSAYTVSEKDRWMGELLPWLRRGGRLVLTDAGLRGLQEVTSIPATAVKRQAVYAGQVSFTRDVNGDGKIDEPDTLSDPLARNVKQPGARFNAGVRRQTYEPTPLGFAIQDETGGDESNARQFDVDVKAFKDAGGRTVATSADAQTRTAQPVPTRVALGELPVGKGTVRVAGGLLPQPETKHDHPLGVEAHALTYTGYILLCNLIDADCRATPDKARAVGGGRCVDRRSPVSVINRRSLRATRRGISLRGRTSDRGCRARGRGLVRRVYVAVYRPVKRGCRYLQANGRLSARRRCNRPILLRAKAKAGYSVAWSFSRRTARRVRFLRGRYAVWVVGRDAAGNQERGRARARRMTYRLRR